MHHDFLHAGAPPHTAGALRFPRPCPSDSLPPPLLVCTTVCTILDYHVVLGSGKTTVKREGLSEFTTAPLERTLTIVCLIDNNTNKTMIS